MGFMIGSPLRLLSRRAGRGSGKYLARSIINPTAPNGTTNNEAIATMSFIPGP